jgi:hypothetical protein
MSYPNPHASQCFWHPFAQRWGAPNIKWCEETLCQFISEPANTWSNLGYLLVACLITYFAFQRGDSRSLKQLGPVIFVMGAASFIYHLSNFYLTQVLDFVGMFLFVGWAIGMNLIRMRKLKSHHHHWFYLGYTVLLVLVMHWMYLWQIKFQVLIVFSALIIIMTEVLATPSAKLNYRYFVTALLFLALAFSFSLSDHTGAWCTPQRHGWFAQGHALWHWTSAIAMWFVYLHYAQAGQEAFWKKQL